MSLKKKIKLLIVDDEKDICWFEKLFFQRHNFKIYTAQTGSKAITSAKKVKPDLALIDIHMKEGAGGIQILQNLRKTHPKCKCIIVTWDKEKALEAKRLGAVDFVLKPAELKDLEKSVNRVAKTLKKQ
ncbi:MAG: response regulator [Candidatus Omnitrophica bacterium]|nr:response regulator [Candidatus Omnitrophota bacterium]